MRAELVKYPVKNPPDPRTEKIIGAAIEVHRNLSPGLLEAIYEEALCIELEMRSLAVQRQLDFDMCYKGHVIKGQRFDLLVENQVVVELKSVATLPDVATSQVLSCLKASGKKRDLLINFGLKKLVDGIVRLSN